MPPPSSISGEEGGRLCLCRQQVVQRACGLSVVGPTWILPGSSGSSVLQRRGEEELEMQAKRPRGEVWT